MKKNFKLLMTFLLCLLGMTAKGQNVAKVGTTEYATIQEAIAAWGPGKTLTLLANVTTTSTVEVEVNATKSTQGWTLNLGDYTWTASGCNAIHLFAAGGTPIHQNYGLKINANQSGGISASGKYAVYYTNQGTCSDSRGYRPRLEINGGTYNASYVVYYGTEAYSSTANGASVFLNKSADGTEPVFNGNFALSKCPVTINAGFFNGTQFTVYRVSSTVEPNIFGGHFKTYNAFPVPGNNKGLTFGNYKVFVRSDASIDMTNGAPAVYEAKATKTLLLSSYQALYYSDYVYYEKANDAIQKYRSGTIDIILAQDVTATENKSFSSGTLTIDATADNSDYTGTITLTGNNAKFIIKFPEGGGHYGVTVSAGGTLHVEETISDGIVTRIYSRIGTVSNPEASVGSTNYVTVFDAFYAIDGTTTNQTIKLLRDVTNAGIVTNGTATGGDGKTVATFDLNGKSIGIGSVTAGNNADYTLTIIDSSEDKTGTVTNTDASLFILALTGINDYSGTYTLKIQAGTWQFDPSNVVINGVTHNLVDEGYVARDNGNGTWTVGEVTYVAQIGETKYVSLAKAVAAAQPNDVITMIADDNVSLTKAGAEITINKPLTITGAVDENGVPMYTIFGSANGELNNTSFNDLFLSCQTGTVKVSNVKFDGFGNEISSVIGHSPIFIGGRNQDAVIENVYISNLNCEGIHINGGTFTIKDCNIDCSKTANTIFTKGICVVNDAQGSIENTTITGVDCDDPNDTSAAIELQGSGEITISGCTIQSNTIGIAATPVQDLTAGTSQVSISDCTVESHNIAIYSNGDMGALTSISSGYYSGLLMAGDNDEGFSISGGFFDDEPQLVYCAEDYLPTDNTDPETMDDYPYTVRLGQFVAKIGDVKYESLTEAVAEAVTGETIELLDDITTETGNKSLKEGVTLDGKGKTISGDIAIYISKNGGTIQNVNFKNIHNATETKSAVYSENLEGTATITGCTFDNCDWDAIQITPVAGANVVITNNTFSDDDEDGITQKRYIHIQSAQNVDFSATINENVMTGNNGGPMDVYYPTDKTNVNLTNNYIEVVDDVLCILVADNNGFAGELAFPAYTTADKEETYSPEAYIQNGQYAAKFYMTFAEAVPNDGNGEKVISLVTNVAGTYIMSEGQTLKVKKNGKTITVKAPDGYVVKSSTTDGVTTYTIVEADIEYTTVNGTVSYKTWSNTVVSGSGTYKLLKNITAAARIVPGALGSDITLDLNGFTLTSTAPDEAVLLARAGTATSHKIFNIVDNSVEGGGTLVVNPNADHAILVNNAGTTKAPYTDVTIGKGVTIEGGCISMLSENSTLTVEGTINGGDDFAVVTNGGTTKNTNITIKDGAVLTSNSVAMYLPGTGTTTIEEGATITGTTGIYVKSGTLNIEGGEITGNGPQGEYTYNDNGCNSTGDALVVDNCGYPGGTPTVNVTGGTFTSTNADAIASYSYGENEPIGEFVHDGYFSSELDRALLEEGKKCVPATEKPGYYKIGDIIYVAQIGDVKYESLTEAVAAVPTDGTETTITLLVDVTENTMIKDGKNIVLDLNEKTLTGSIDQYDSQLKVENGTLTGTVWVNGAATETSNYNSFTLDATATITNDFGVVLYQAEGTTAGYGSTININGTVNGTVWVMGNITEGNSVINANSGAKISGDVGVALNGLATLNVADGATITGAEVGIEARAGVLNVTGGKIASTASNYEVKPNGSGTTTIGAAIAVAQHTTGLTTQVNISGGEFEGIKSLSIANPQGNTADNVCVSVSDGKFSGEVVNTDTRVDGFITGGIYTAEVPEEYCAPGYICTDNEDDATKVQYPYTVKSMEDAGIFELWDTYTNHDADAEYPYKGTVDMDNVEVTYHRTFKDSHVDKFQAWFVPMDYTIKAEDLENFKFWKIHMVAGSRDPQGGAVDENNEDNLQIWIHIFSMDEGDVLKGNRPYVITPKVAGDFDFTEESTKIYPAEPEPTCHLKLATSYYIYNFYGTYEPYITSKARELIGLGGGKIRPNGSGDNLGIYRWYIKPTSNNYNDDYSNLRIGFVVDGEEDPTSIFAIEDADGSDEISGIYSVNGTKYGTTMDDLQKGVNIIRYKNGTSKKVLVK